MLFHFPSKPLFFLRYLDFFRFRYFFGHLGKRLDNKAKVNLVYLPHFLYNALRKLFLMLCFINWPNFIVCLRSLLEIFGNNCNYLFTSYDAIDTEINLSFLSKPFSYMSKNFRTKSTWRTKKHFSSFFTLI